MTIDRLSLAGLAPWTLRRTLLVALLLRLPAVVWADGYGYPDQQFQYVEPAWHLATGAAWHEPWEFQDGMRSWVYPGCLAALFRGLLALGVDGPAALLAGARGCHALLSLLPVWLFWLALGRWRHAAPATVPLLLWLGSGLPLFGLQPSGPAWSQILAVSAGLALHGPGRFPLLAGLCLGFAFCGRFQDAIFGPAFLLTLCWQRRLTAAGWFVAGCLPGILLQGCVDVAAGGAFLGSMWQNVFSNIVLTSSQAWRTQPFWFYWLAGVAPVLALAPGVLGVAVRRCLAGARLLPGAAAGALLHLLAHSFVLRKALRFEYPALTLALAVLLAGLPAATGRAARWHVGLLAAVHFGLWCVASLWFGNAGAVRASLWLREQPAMQRSLVVIDGDASNLAGAFYLAPARDHIQGMSLAVLGERIASGA
jgi:hypothetical protein